MNQYKMTKAEAERILEFAGNLKTCGITFQGFSFGDGKYYGKKFLEGVCDNGGIVIQEEPLTFEEHIVAVPDNGCFFPDNTYIGMVNATAREITGSRP